MTIIKTIMIGRLRWEGRVGRMDPHDPVKQETKYEVAIQNAARGTNGMGPQLEDGCMEQKA